MLTKSLIFTPLRADLIHPLEKERVPSKSGQLHNRLYFTGREGGNRSLFEQTAFPKMFADFRIRRLGLLQLPTGQSPARSISKVPSRSLPTNTTHPKGQAAKNTPLHVALFILPVNILPHPQFPTFKP